MPEPAHAHARVQRAAVVVELTDGTRMVYTFKPERPLTFTLEPLYPSLWAEPLAFVRGNDTQLTVEGILAEGRIWTDPMPGDQARELAASPRQIEAS